MDNQSWASTQEWLIAVRQASPDRGGRTAFGARSVGARAPVAVGGANVDELPIRDRRGRSALHYGGSRTERHRERGSPTARLPRLGWRWCPGRVSRQNIGQSKSVIGETASSQMIRAEPAPAGPPCPSSLGKPSAHSAQRAERRASNSRR